MTAKDYAGTAHDGNTVFDAGREVGNRRVDFPEAELMPFDHLPIANGRPGI
jgi:hypothetical protein